MIFDKLDAYGDSDYYGFHMPGHKRTPGLLPEAIPYKIDITEIEGFDDLHHSAGILKEAEKRAARLYNAQETHFLVNGSTAGILSAILGVTQKGDTVLVARNCHKSVYHAIYLNELEPVYLYPEFCLDAFLNSGICVEEVVRALEQYPAIKAVIIVSPTYDGVVSDVEGIAKIAHEKNVPLIVDEAHGAHFGFHSYFPNHSNAKQADIVIHSLHKTLPSLTQTALIHMNGTLVSKKNVRKYLHIFQTSSPSYVLMASIDACMELMEQRSEHIFGSYVQILDSLRKELSHLKHLHLVSTGDFDPSKIIISVKDTAITSRELYEILLEKYHLQMEMAAGTYVLAMTSVGDRAVGMERLKEALFQIDETLESRTVTEKESELLGGRIPPMEKVYASGIVERMAKRQNHKKVAWEESVGCISLEYAYLYPPGCPLIVPGEKVSKEAAHMLQWYKDIGFSIEGLEEEGRIEVLIDG